MYEYYENRLGKLFLEDDTLKRPFNSIFTAASYNLGPQVVCFPHVDFANLPFGWCAITAIGNFDPKKGGHLILWDYKLIIEFPPGSTILIPSAIIKHSNTKIFEGETRYSFTQFAAGGLFRWVDNKFQTLATYRDSLTKEERLELEKANEGRWRFGLGLFSRFPFT